MLVLLELDLWVVLLQRVGVSLTNGWSHSINWTWIQKRKNQFKIDLLEIQNFVCLALFYLVSKDLQWYLLENFIDQENNEKILKGKNNKTQQWIL